MPPPAAPDLEALLAHAGWIRALARSLVADPNLADDLVQQTWVAALEHPPGPATPIRRWLAAVLRNFARQERRGERRRSDRESVAARPEPTSSAHEAAETVAIQRELFEAVLALEEPYRAAIYRRYYDGLSPREIARRASVPVKTVKTRLHRGLEKLRVDLDRRHGGDRRAWLPVLLPLAGWPGLPAATLGAALVNTKIKVAIAALAIAGTLVVVWSVAPSGSNERRAPALAAAPDPELEKPDTAPALAPTPAAETRERALEPVVEESSGPAAPAPAETIALARGRVVDVEGRAVADVPLCLQGQVVGASLEAIRSAESGRGSPVATSRADGSFEMPAPPKGGTLVACSPQLTTVFGAELWQMHSMADLVVVVAPRGGLAGVVVDPEAHPIEGAVVEVRAEHAMLKTLAGIADQSFELPWRSTTDAVGRFEIADAPSMRGAELSAWAAGFDVRRTGAPDRPTFDVRIILAPDPREHLFGEVLDARGRPVPGAHVGLGGVTTRTDELGRFALQPGRVVELGESFASPDEILAVKEGFLPARYARPAGGWPAFVTLRLDGEPLSIRGRVVDEEGRAVPGAEVWAVDEHGFGVEMEEVGSVGFQKSMERLLRGGAETASSGADGAFEIGGLLPGEYRLACLQRSTMAAGRTAAIAAGREGVEVELAGAAKCARVAGRVVSRGGKPVPGVMLFPGRRELRWPWTTNPFFVRGESATTDAQGKFEFARLDPAALSFQISSPDVFVTEWKPAPGAKLDDLEVVVSLKCHLQVDLGERKAFAGTFSALDADGKILTLFEHRGPVAWMHDDVPIVDGRSPVVAVPEEARTIVFKRQGEEVARMPLDLAPGELTIVRP